jgi:rhamnulokinase
MTDSAEPFAAVDLGAESGRVMLGRVGSGGLTLEEVQRFPNTPVSLPDGLHWNSLALYEQMLSGLCRAVADNGRLAGIGIDAWGVDYGLLDGRRRLLGVPYHYRDARTEGMVELASQFITPAERYARTGIQTMPINTLFQLLAERESPALQAAEHIALIPDLLGMWLTDRLVNEATIASTTGMLDARSGEWARDLVAAHGLPTGILHGNPVEPGTPLGPVRAGIEALAGLPVWNVAAHDTASAFIAAPVSSPNSAILSSGTWSLLGVEVDAPVLDRSAAAFNFTNERGVDGSIRFLRNVMGLWLMQECRRHWMNQGAALDYSELERLASTPGEGVALFDPDHPDLLRHGDMPSRIAGLCEAAGEPAPSDPGQFVRAILTSLACKYNFVLQRCQIATGRHIDAINVIGGGVRNRALCQLTADITGLPVVAGPVEATALGNILVQARAAGMLGSLAEMRELVAGSCPLERYEPADDGRAPAIYERFLAVTGLRVQSHEPTLA